MSDVVASGSAELRPELRGSRYRRRSLILGFALGSTVMAAPKYSAGTSPGDIGVLATILMSLLWTAPRERQMVWRRLRPIMPGLVLAAAGSAIALIAVGLPSWALTTIAADLYLLVFGFSSLSLLATNRTQHRQVAVGLFPWVLYAAVVGVVQGHDQLGGWYSHPNLNAYALVMVALSTVILWPSARARIVVAGVAVVGVVGGASFGAITSGIVGGFVLLQSRVDGLKKLVLLSVLLLAALTLVGPVRGLTGQYTDSQNSRSELSSDRLDKTAVNRFEIWADAIDQFREEPFGLAPYGIAQDGDVEVHSDYISYLVERGPLGLIGMLWVVWGLLRVGRYRSPVVAIVSAAVVAGVFRETLHFRTLWVALAVALAVSWREAEVVSREL